MRYIEREEKLPLNCDMHRLLPCKEKSKVGWVAVLIFFFGRRVVYFSLELTRVCGSVERALIRLGLTFHPEALSQLPCIHRVSKSREMIVSQGV